MDDNVHLRRLMRAIGISYPSIKKYLSENAIPAHVCLQLEQLSGGNFKPAQLRPDLFLHTIEHVHLADAMLRAFVEDKVGSTVLFITSLNLLQAQAPVVYERLLAEIKDIDSDYVRMRTGSVSN